MERKRVLVRVRGIVQGVLYRASTREEAARLGLSGWVRNVEDGSVEFVAEGDRDAVDALVAWARRGPPAARVASVDVEEQAPTDERGEFQVRR